MKRKNTKKPIDTVELSQKDKDIKDYVRGQVIRRGARWFYWIAGLSAVNTFFYLSNGNLEFPAGLFITETIDVFAKSWNLVGLGIVINALIMGLFVLVGYKGSRFSKKAFMLGITVYVLDLAALVLFIVTGKDFTVLAVNVVFHLLALRSIYFGMEAIKKRSV